MELKHALDAILAHDYAELFELFVENRGVIDQWFVLDAVIEQVEAAMENPREHDMYDSDIPKLMGIYAQLTAMRAAWDADLLPDDDEE